MQDGQSNEEQETFKLANQQNFLLLVVELVQVICFVMGMVFFCQKNTKYYLFYIWIEEVLLEAFIIILAIMINAVLQDSIATSLVTIGGVLSLGVVIFETCREQSAKKKGKDVDEGYIKPERIKKLILNCVGCICCTFCIIPVSLALIFGFIWFMLEEVFGVVKWS